MSKGGGAGKVYFVLYLAVVLELLIIIVERDEAEESLHKKQKETMKIVESILSQLQSGAGTEGINTRPQDEITIPPQGVNIKEVLGTDIKSSRKYIVEVGVTDISAAVKQREGESGKEYQQRLKKLIELANVEEIEYQIFYNSSLEAFNAPYFPSDERIAKEKWDFTKFQPGQTVEGPDGSQWEFMGLRKLVLDKDKTHSNLPTESITPELIVPYYPNENKVNVGPTYGPPNMPDDSIFYYSINESIAHQSEQANTGDLKKRAFVVNFQPPAKAGWFKLRFASRTNRILGVRSEVKFSELSDETTVNIGTVSLTVKDLMKVQKQLTSQLEKYNLPSFDDFVKSGDIEVFDSKLKAAKELAKQGEDAVEISGKIDLFGYIAKLLAPGQSVNFDQNRGAIEFNVRVILPKPQIATPEIVVTKYVPGFDKIPPVFQFTISPYQGPGTNTVVGEVKRDGATVARIECRPLDEIAEVGAAKPMTGGAREYRGIVAQTLPPGKYTIELKHSLSGRSTDQKTDLEIFKTKLTDESDRKINSQLNVFAYYGYPVTIDAIPESGGKIPADQFRIYLKTDRDQQRNPFVGLSVTPDDKFILTPDANSVNLRIAWRQPFTGQEVDLFADKKYEIKQEEPSIIIGNAITDVSGSAAKLRIRITNISMTKPGTGDSRPPQIKASVGKADKASGLATYEIAVDPTIDGDENGYNIEFEMQGSLPRGETRIRGTVNIPIIARAINPVNGKESEPAEMRLTVNINYEPDRGGPARRR